MLWAQILISSGKEEMLKIELKDCIGTQFARLKFEIQVISEALISSEFLKQILAIRY